MIVLESRQESKLPIEVDAILPAALAGKSAREIGRLMIWVGREQIELGQVFRIAADSADDRTIRWSGELNNVHRIGQGLQAGLIEIETACGRHVGSQMSGGQIIARGDVGDFAGAEMRGGLLEVRANAANHLGGAYPGSKFGMNRGEILVTGNAGAGVGSHMRRGMIAVKGSVGRLAGWNMLAGTIVIGGACDTECGSGMVRGSIIRLAQKGAPLLPTFIPGGTSQQTILRLIGYRLHALGAGFDTAQFDTPFLMYHGDQLCGGRGEVFVAGLD